MRSKQSWTLTQENVFEGNHLRMPWEVLAGCVWAPPEQGPFTKALVFKEQQKLLF